MDKVSGIVTDILRFRGSADRGGVLTLRDARGATHKVLGVTEGVEVGSFIYAEGKPFVHPTYGPQLRAHTVRVDLPTTRDAAPEWLYRHFRMTQLQATALITDWYNDFANLGQAPTPGTVTIKGAGDFELLRLWTCLGAAGVSARSVENLFKRHSLEDVYSEVREYVVRKNTIDGLVAVGLNTREAQLLYKVRGSAIIDEMKTDPYVAYLYVDTISFKKMDDIYLQLKGTGKTDDHRLRAMCLFYLRKDASDNGHTAIEYDDFLHLMEERKERFSATKILHNLHRLIPDFVTQYGNPTMLQLTHLAEYEDGIAEWITTGKIKRTDDNTDDSSGT